jgi:ribosomal protein S18 acetylase RimI-like enzyme
MGESLTENLLLVRPVAARPAFTSVPIGYEAIPVHSLDATELGRAYFASVGVGEGWSDLPGAIEDVRAAFNGDYGPLLAESSLALIRAGDIAAAVLTVGGAPWEDVPPGAFVIDLFTDPAHRRRGLARWLLQRAIGSLPSSFDGGPISLRVETENQPAIALYTAEGFRAHLPETND